MTLVDNMMDLQLFAGDKTEKATLKKRRDARERGQVFRSQEMNSAIILLVSFTTLKFILPTLLEKIQKIYTEFLTDTAPIDQIFTHQGIVKLALDVIMTIGTAIGPLLLISLAAGLAINYGQVGFLFTTKTIAPKFSKINPLEGFKRIFSRRSLVDLAKAIIKLAIIGSIVYTEIKKNVGNVDLWYMGNFPWTVNLIGNNVFSVVIRIGIILFIFAVLDYGYEWWQYETDLMMTKQEVKDEFKLTEGDPQIRSRIRGKQRELGMRRMMQEIPKADVVITNPTHYAIAISYDPDHDDAPIVIAKGQGHLAIRIKEVAQANGIVITENKPLARALYNSTDVGQMIPAELFHGVAEVLAFVYDLKGKTV
ncbi:MAG TPA: flagellar biosynthesis protein FlhB [Clostridia bacterium]|nr:flagellar biosynthesis protein FlhB [Clostridia bacterium]